MDRLLTYRSCTCCFVCKASLFWRTNSVKTGRSIFDYYNIDISLLTAIYILSFKLLLCKFHLKFVINIQTLGAKHIHREV